MPATPDIVLEGDGGGGEGEKSDEDAKAGGDGVVAKETVGVADDYGPADEKPGEDAGVGAGVQLNESGVAVDDDPAKLGAFLVDDDSDMVPVGGGDSFDDQIGQETHDSAADEAAQFGHGVQDDGPRMDENVVAVSDDGKDALDEDGARMDGVATTAVNDMEAELVKADDDVAEEGTQMDTLASTGNDDREEGAATAGDTSTDEGRQMDATSMSRDVNEEKATGAAGVDATGEDIQVDTVGLTGDGNQEIGVSSAGDDGAGEDGMGKYAVIATGDDDDDGTGEEGMEKYVVIATGDEDEEDGMADQNVAEEADSVLEETEADMVGNDVAEEGTKTDILASTEEGVATAGDASTDEGRQMDAVSICRDVNEEKATGAAGVDAAGEDIEVGTVGLTGDNKENEVASAGDDGADEDGIEKYAVTTAGDEDEDGMADQSVAEEADSVPEEAEVDMVGNDIPEEEDMQIDEDDNDDEPPPVTRKGGGRPKRGRPSSKVQAVVKPSVKRKEDDEEVCFICFDGGDLVVCDRRGCPKAYHPSCVNRDDDFFKSKGRWTCGWHICSNCQKPAHSMCYTCTYSLCKVCIKESKFICVRGNKGFCETCMNTVMLIENKELATEQMDVDFDDKSSWWYLFKDYWLNLKAKLSLTLEEISAARPQKNASALVIRDNDLSEVPDTNDEEEANSDSSSGRHLESNSSKKKGTKRLKRAAAEDSSKGKKESTRRYTKRGSRDAKNSTGTKVRKLSKRASSSEHRPKESESVGTSTSSAEEASWASKELLDFVARMRNGDKSVQTQFEVQGLLLEYIKRENLRDPRKKSQIVCDPLLESLFGKPRVGHFEMLKLLESHFLTSEVSPADIDDNHGGVVDPDPSQNADGNSEASVVMSSEKRRKSRKYDQRALQTNLDDFAAIDNHNISLIYLRRNLMEELIGDVDTFDEKVLGSFVRIRISGTGQRQDIYRLVQIVGTGTAAEKYKCGKKTTDIILEILNLDKKEIITIDITSNQEFTEEECKRLRQSIKYGFIPRLTVGEVQEKARILQSVKVNDWIESEKTRLGHLRDRASDMGHRKELRECVEKLQLLSTPEERARRLKEEPEIHADPTMDPDYESPEEQEEDTERSSFNKPRGSFFRKDSNPVSPGKGEGRSAAQRDSKTNWESNRNPWGESSTHLEAPLGRRSTFSSHGENAGYTGKSENPKVGAHTVKVEATTGNAQRGLSGSSSQTLTANVGSGATPASQLAVNESEKIWQYMDPSSKVQGPFSIVQLRKWNNSGYFPPNLKIWKSSEKQDDSILLADALVGKFEKDLPPWEPPLSSSSQIDRSYLRSNSDVGARPSNNSLIEESTKAGEQTSNSAVPTRSQSFSGRVGQRHDYDTTNPGSTMIQSGAQGYYGVQNSQPAYSSQQPLTGSWNASSSQFGTTVNPMTLSQPAIGGFSGQNNAVAGNAGQLTPGPAPATASAEIVNSQLQSQNQIASVLPQRDDRFVDGNGSKLGEDSSYGRTRSSGEDLGPVGAQPGAAQSNTQQLEDARNQSTDASNSMVSSQLMSTPSAETVQPLTNITGGDSQSSGWPMPANTSGQAQGGGNMNWGAALQGNTSMGWGMMGQTNMNMPWGAPAQGATNYNMGLTMPTQPNAVPNMGWVAQNPGNTNMNMMWAATQSQGTPNAATMMGAQMQGVAMAPWGAITQGNANPYPGWGTQVGNMNQNVGWSAPVQGNPGPNPVNGAGQGNNNMNWNSPSGNPSWNNQQEFNGGDAGGRSLRSQPGGGGSPGYMRGVCYSFANTGRCSRKADCRYLHVQTNDGYSSRQDRRFDRQALSNERPQYDRQNERNDHQFDRQPSGNERHYDRQPSGNERRFDRHDDRHSDRDNDRQADRSGSRERQ